MKSLVDKLVSRIDSIEQNGVGSSSIDESKVQELIESTLSQKTIEEINDTNSNSNMLVTAKAVKEYVESNIDINTGNFSLEENGSVQSVADDNVSIAGGDGEIIVNGCDDVTVYTLGGSLVSDGQVNVNVPAGFYIVKAGGKVAKVAVK